MRVIAIAAAFFALATLITACTTETPADDLVMTQERVCAVLPLSGPVAIYGQEISRGMQLAADERQARLYLEDDGYEKKNTVTATTKLIDSGCKRIVLADVATGTAAAPVLAAEDVQGIILWDRTEYTDSERQLSSMGFKTEAAGERMADFAFARQARRIVILRDENEWSFTISDAFSERFRQRGGTVVQTMTLSPGDDFRSTIAKIEALDPDAAYFPFAINDPAAFVKRAREQELDMVLFSADGFTDDMIAAAGTAAEGVCKTDAQVMVSDRLEAVLTAYREKYGADSATPLYMLAGYDAVSVVLQRHSETEIDSILGDEISLGKDAPPRLEKIFCIENGKKVLMER
jgi:ABC-type branched-subunit amino acid transport system substrate-binding protein